MARPKRSHGKVRWEEHWEAEEEKKTFIGKIITKKKIEDLNYLFIYLDYLCRIDTVLEVGCGEGNLTPTLESHGFNYLGIDYTKRSIDLCKRKGLNVQQKDLFSIKKRYDLVMSDGVLEHYLNFSTVIKKMCQLSKKYVLIIQPDHSTKILRILLLLESIFKPTGNVHEYNFQISDYIEAFKRCGFNLERQTSVFFGGYVFLLFRRGNK